MDACALRVENLIRQFQLQPHPEGGYYRETYRAVQNVHTLTGAERNASTAIYYLLSDRAYSAWHRIASDEVWHFYAGSPLDMHRLDDSGQLVTHRLGNAQDLEGAVFQAVAPAGCWFGAELVDPDGYALVGCTVAPGFDFSEFELARDNDLLRWHSRYPELIERLLGSV